MKYTKQAGLWPLFAVIAGSTLSQAAHSGGVINKQSFSTAYNGVLSRNAAIGTLDTTVFNPGGVITLQDGWSIGADAAYLAKDYANEIGGTKFESDLPSIVPGLFAAYRWDDWAAFGAVVIPGGGGSVDYDDGDATTVGVATSLLATVGAPYNGIGPATLEATSYGVGYRVGVARKVNDIVSLSGGLQYVDAQKSVTADASITSSLPIPDISTTLDYEQDATGWGYFIGAHFTPMPKLDIGLRYDSAVKLDYKANVKEASQDSGNPALDAFPLAVLASIDIVDGQKLREDLPAVLGVGARYEVDPAWFVTGSYTRYMEKQAEWESDRLDVSKNAYDLALSVGWQATPQLMAEFGLMRTEIGLDADDMLAPAPELDALTTGVNFRWQAASNTAVNFAVSKVDYESATTTTGVKYTKDILGLSIGFEHRFE
jgi:long-chain fatty acid transport protein